MRRSGLGATPTLSEFGGIAGRRILAQFDGGRAAWDGGLLLPGSTDKAIELIGRFAACFRDRYSQSAVERSVAARAWLVGVCDRTQLQGSQRS